MSTTVPPRRAPERGLIERCAAGEDDAWRELITTHAALIEAVVVCALHDSQLAKLDESQALTAQFWEDLRANDAEILRDWNGTSLRHYLALVARRTAESYLHSTTTTAQLVTSDFAHATLTDSSAPDLVPSAEPAPFDKLSLQFQAMIRLRRLGLDLDSIAAVLGMSQASVTQNMQRAAHKLTQLQTATPSQAQLPTSQTNQTDLELAWRLVLGCAPTSERVDAALRSEQEPALRAIRDRVQITFAQAHDMTAARPCDSGKSCLSELDLVYLVDGTMRGSAKAAAESQLSSCMLCLYAVANLTLDMRMARIFRDAKGTHRALQVAAACIATERASAAEIKAREALDEGALRAAELIRVALVAHNLPGREAISRETSRVVTAPQIPTDLEAPIMGIEALVSGDVTGAYRAVDEHGAKQNIGARLRLLAAAAGHDLPEAHERAEEILSRTSADPGLRRDAEAVAALPDHRALPREILLERLADALPDLARFLITHSGDAPV